MGYGDSYWNSEVYPAGWLYVHLVYWTVPVFFIMVYMAVGSDFFLFRHFDELALFFITDNVPMWSFNIKGLTMIAMILGVYRY